MKVLVVLAILCLTANASKVFRVSDIYLPQYDSGKQCGKKFNIEDQAFATLVATKNLDKSADNLESYVHCVFTQNNFLKNGSIDVAAFKANYKNHFNPQVLEQILTKCQGVTGNGSPEHVFAFFKCFNSAF